MPPVWTSIFFAEGIFTNMAELKKISTQLVFIETVLYQQNIGHFQFQIISAVVQAINIGNRYLLVNDQMAKYVLDALDIMSM